MSNSIKKSIFKFKDGGSSNKKILRRRVKRYCKNFLRTNFYKIVNGDLVIPNDKSIVNDWEYCDFKYDLEHRKNKSSRITDDEFLEIKKKLSRK